MDKTYLFFDVECANCFDGVGKMCSFGYVLTDGDFNVIDTDDVVMNPECEFDWYLFSPKNKCPLAYSKDYFRAQHNFESYYKPIRQLMEASDRKIIGFSTRNDVGFVTSACERYGFQYINFSAYDVAVFIDAARNQKKGLAEWCEEYKVDVSKLQAHKSQDDAMMTMLLTKAFCEEQKITIDELLEKNKGTKISVEKYIEQREMKRHTDEVMKQITDLFGKKCRARLTNRLNDGQFAFGFKPKNDVDLSYSVAETIYKHGGMIQRHLKNQGTIIVDETVSPESVKELESRGLKTMTVQELFDLCDMEKK